jgi:hypothetical protein
VYVNAKAWEFLPNDYEQIFEMTRSDAHVEMQAKYDARNRDALRRLVCYGVNVRQFPREVGVTAWKASNDIYAELSQWSANWEKIYASFVKFRDNQILWSRFSEGAYENLLLQMRNPSTKG